MSEEIEVTGAEQMTSAAPSGAVVVSGTEAPQQGTEAAGGAPEASGTLAGSDPVDRPVAAPADWPDDWRAKLAGEDAKEMARLQRLGSPADVWKAYRALEAKISSGQLRAGMKPDATPEEAAAWRKEQGLPETPEGYTPKLPDGSVPGEAEMPLIGGFQKTAHELGLTSDQFNKVLGWYFGESDTAKANAFEQDRSFRQQAEDNLRAEWGAGYRSELKGINNFMEANAPAGLSETLFNARTADGKLLGDHPEFLRWLSSTAKQMNPMATLVPAGTTDVMKAGEARIAEIEQIMRTDSRAYWTNPATQEEYGKLLEARETTRGRAA